MTGQSGFNRLLFAGLLLGITFSILVLSTKKYIRGQLVTILQEEAAASCKGCQFKVDDLSISFLNLSAKARNARIEQNNDAKLIFPIINLYFNLSEIFQRKIYLSELELKSGLAKGISDESVTFQFIDHLSTPSPKTSAEPKLRVILETLSIHDSRIIENLGQSNLIAEGVNLKMARNDKGNFLLDPRIENLKIISATDDSEPAEFRLGKVSGEVELDEGLTRFLRLRLKDGASNVWLRGISDHDKNNQLSGKLSKKLTSKALRLKSVFAGSINGKADVSGRLARPIITGKYDKTLDPAKIKIGEQVNLDIDKLDGNYKLRFTDDGPKLESNLSLSAESAGLNLSGPLTLDTENINTNFDLSCAEIEVAGVTVKDFQGTLKVTGAPDNPKTELSGNILAANYIGADIPALSVRLTLLEDFLQINANSAALEAPRSFNFQANINLADENNTYRITSKDYPILTKAQSTLGYFSSELNIQQSNGLNLKGGGPVEFLPAFLSDQGAEQVLRGNLKFNREVLLGNLETPYNTLFTNFSVDLSEKTSSSLKVKALGFPQAQSKLDQRCLNLSGELDYSFLASTFFQGQGELTIDELQIGCQPHTMRTDQKQKLKVSAGEIILDKAQLLTRDTALQLSGQIGLDGSLDLKSKGSLDLKTLLPLVGGVDDLRGQAELNANITGAINDPEILGEIILQDAGLDIEAANIELRDLQGKVNIAGNKLNANTIKGELNQGSIEASGVIDLESLGSSLLSAKFKGLNLEPYDNTNIVLSGDLEIGSDENLLPLITGDISLDYGIFEQDLKLKNLIADVSSYLLGTSRKKQSNSISDLPEILLDLNFKATRNFFVVTNVWQSELSSKIKIAGTLSNPQLDGNVRSLSGWFGFGDRGFEIVSGTVNFRPDQSSPSIDILGETQVIANNGGIVSVYLELGGDLENPRLQLSSDRNFSQGEILALLGSSSREFDSTNVNRSTNNTNILGFSLLGDSSSESSRFSGLLSNLTKIDSFSVEPAINPDTGLVEPQFIAKRNLDSNLSLIGESFLGSTTGNSRAKLLYRLTPKLNVATIADSSSAQRRSSLGIDLTYTFLAKRKEWVNYSFTGNNSITSSELLALVRIDGSTRIGPAEIEYIAERLREIYLERGYLAAEIDVSCNSLEGLCRKVFFEIKENSPYKIEKINLREDSWPSEIPKPDFGYLNGATATLSNCNQVTRQVIRTLRNEGYIQARLNCSYEAQDDQTVEMYLKLNSGTPVSFIFIGNESFTDQELLQTIDLFGRKQPFGNNTINILLERIERLYRENGYLYATISASLSDPNAARALYRISVEEGPKLTVSEVRFKQLDQVSQKQLKKLARARGTGLYNRIFKPRYLVAEEVSANINELKDIFTELGFPKSSISYQIQEDQENTLRLVYTVIEGKPEEKINLDLKVDEHLPLISKSLTLKRAPKREIEKRVNNKLNFLRDSGFIQAKIAEDKIEQGTRTVRITPGAPTKIKRITLRGNYTLSDREILAELESAPGKLWSKRMFNRDRSKLLRDGLIASAVFSAADGEVNSNREILLIEINEKALQTLELGAGANSELGAHIFGGASDLSFFRDGRALSARFDIYYDPTEDGIKQGTAGLGYYVPEFFDHHSLNSDIRFQRFDLPTLPYDQDRVAWENTLYRAQKRGVSYDLAYRLSEDQLDSVNPSAILSDLDTGSILLSTLEASLRYDQRDNAINTQSGYLAVLSSKLSAEALGSEANYSVMEGKLSFVQPLSSTPFSFANNSNVALARAFGGDQQVPLAERYFTGGRNSVRGFRENSLGPQAEDGTVVGGDLLIINNLELRYRTSDWFSVHMFLDGGGAYLENEGLTSSDLRWSAGTGFRYLSPVGPVGFDFGMPLAEKEGEPSGRLHFSIGSNF